MIEVEPDVIYSTRRLGAPMTFFKRLLLRLLRQYLVELEARQTRFNIAMLAAYQELDRRVEALERRTAASDGRSPGCWRAPARTTP